MCKAYRLRFITILDKIKHTLTSFHLWFRWQKLVNIWSVFKLFRPFPNWTAFTWIVKEAFSFISSNHTPEGTRNINSIKNINPTNNSFLKNLQLISLIWEVDISQCNWMMLQLWTADIYHFYTSSCQTNKSVGLEFHERAYNLLQAWEEWHRVNASACNLHITWEDQAWIMWIFTK